MSQPIQCSVTITETGGRIDIIASIPDDAEGSIAGVLAQALLGHANKLMSETIGVERQNIQKMANN